MAKKYWKSQGILSVQKSRNPDLPMKSQKDNVFTGVCHSVQVVGCVSLLPGPFQGWLGGYAWYMEGTPWKVRTSSGGHRSGRYAS